MIRVEISASLIVQGLRQGNEVRRTQILEGLPDNVELFNIDYDRHRGIVTLDFLDGRNVVTEQPIVCKTIYEGDA